MFSEFQIDSTDMVFYATCMFKVMCDYILSIIIILSHFKPDCCSQSTPRDVTCISIVHCTILP